MSVIDDVIRREGSLFTNHPADKGGPTKYGVTLSTLSTYRHKACSPSDVEQLTEQEARAIYYSLYLLPYEFVSPDDKDVFELLVDSAVQHGVGWANKFLQRALKVKDDGVVGQATKAAYFKHTGGLLGPLLAERILFYARIVEASPSQSVFIEGWMNRMAEFLRKY